MRLSLTTGGKIVQVDFVSEIAVPTPECYLLVYQYNVSRYIIKDGTVPDIVTDSYSAFHVAVLHQIFHGHFFYEGKKIGAQVGFYMNRFCRPRLVPALLEIEFPLENSFGDANSDIFFTDILPRYECMVLDLGDFNRTRRALGLEEYTLKKYIAQKFENFTVDDWGINLNEETSFFSPLPDKFDEEKVMTVNGMRMFIEDQDQKKSNMTSPS